MKISLKLIIKINNENDHKRNAPLQICALLEIKTNQVSNEREVDMQWLLKLVFCGLHDVQFQISLNSLSTWKLYST